MMTGLPRFAAFSLAKAGNAEDENEDRFAAQTQRWLREGDLARIALSDGATESAFAREWANILVHSRWHEQLGVGLVHQASDAMLDQGVAPWLDDVRRQLAARTEELLPTLPWYGRAKAREGAAASFLGLRVQRTKKRRLWSAVACGDTCLFHLSGEDGIIPFPLDSPDAFGNRPMLVPSINTRQKPEFIVSRGLWKHGDRFVLATDALAAWLLDSCVQQERFAALIGCDDDATFAALVEHERLTGRLKNDDTTALIYRP